MNRLSCFILVLFLPLVTSLRGQSLNERLNTVLASPRDTHQLYQLSEILTDLINVGEIVPDTLFERALTLAKELEETWSLASIYLDRSVYDLNTGEAEKGLVSVNEAIKYAQVCNKNFLVASAYATKMELLMIAGYTKESAELASTMAKEYHETGDLYYEAQTYQVLSKLSSSLGNYELTMIYDSTAIALAEQSEYVDVWSSVLCSSSENLSLLGHPEEALVMAEEAMLVAEEYELDFEVGNALSARAIANTALGNFSEALRDYELLKKREGEQKYTWWMISRGILLQRIGRHDESRKPLLEAVSMVKESSNNPDELRRAYQALQTADLNQLQYDSVIWYGNLMEAAQDSLQAAKNIKTLLELKEKYETEEKEVKIQLQQEQLAAQRIKLYATIFGMLLALVAGAVLFFLSQRLIKKNKENEQLLIDKETLIGEIHHRVKNNLQVVSSLLQLQRRGLGSDDEKGREALLESQGRVSAMGLIHNKLYQGEEVTSVHMPEYLEDLGETLLDAYRLKEQVEIFYDVSDISLDVDLAIPLGLIINELIANSLKYAFPKGREGTIEIALHRKDGKLSLVVNDDGVGADAAEKDAYSTSFGNNLIELLTKKLKGSLRMMEGKGYGVEIVFVE